jgi:hypothetical protein
MLVKMNQITLILVSYIGLLFDPLNKPFLLKMQQMLHLGMHHNRKMCQRDNIGESTASQQVNQPTSAFSGLVNWYQHRKRGSDPS